MKKVFEYVGLGVLAIFSFYYTDKVISLTNEKDPIMQEIVNYASKVNNKCVEGYVTSEGVVLGVSGIIVDEKMSYSNMKGFGYDKELLVFNEDECSINEENNLDNYIIRGNESKNAVSIIISVVDGNKLEYFVDISQVKDVKLTFSVTGEILEKNKDYFKILYNSGYDVIYGGVNESDFKKYLTIMNDFNENSRKYCIYNKEKVMIELCSKNKINSVKSELVFNKNILSNTKNNVGAGALLIYKENNNTTEELSSTINFIKAKGLKIMTISEHL